MMQPKIKLLLQNDITFSVSEIVKSAVMIVAGVFSVILLAFFTFEGEYFSGVIVERVLELLGLASPNWMNGHHDFFLHEVQTVFIITFIIEIFYVISRYMRGWKF